MATPIPQADYSVNEDDLLLFNDTDVLDDDLLDNTDLAVYDAAWMAEYPENPLFKFKIDGSFKYDARYHEPLRVTEQEVEDTNYNYEVVGTLVEESTTDAVELENGFDSLAAGAVVYDTYTFIASDGWNTTEPVEAVVKIVGVNDDPDAVDDSAVFDPATATQGGEEGSEYQYIAIDVLANDSDVDVWPDADTLSITALEDIADGSDPVGSPDSDTSDGLEITTDAGGILSLDDSGELHYIAADGFFGIDTVRYTVSDGNGGEDTAELRITVLPDNGNPVATDDTYTMETVEGEQVRTYLYSVGEDHSTGEAPEVTTEKDFGTDATDDGPSVLDNDTDPDSDELAALLTVPDGDTPILRRVDKDGNAIVADEYGNSILDEDDKPIVGELTDFNSDGSFTYDHQGLFQSLAEGESAYVAFDYSAYDGDSLNDDAMVMIEIQGANDTPEGESPDAVKVYEAGLEIYDESDNLIIKGSGDHRELVDGSHELVAAIPTTQTIRIKVSDVDLSDLDGLFIVAVDENGDPIMDENDSEAYAKEVEGSYGTLDLDPDDGGLKQDTDGIYFEAGDYYYEVTYTLEKNADHGNTQGHNGGIYDDFYFRVADEHGGLSEWKSEEELGEDEDNLKIEVQVIDDVNFLAELPVDGNGVPIGTLDTLDDKDVAFADGAVATDTFTLVPGADGQTLDVVGIPNTFTLADGREVRSEVVFDEDYDSSLDADDDADEMVVGNIWALNESEVWVDTNEDFYTLIVDPDPDSNATTLLGAYTLTMFQDPPVVINNLDFSALKAGGPQEDVTVQNIGFDGGFFTDRTDLYGTFDDEGIPNNSDDFINPNNAGGIGIGNGNIERFEVLEIDVTGSSGVTAVEMDIQGVGGGIGVADVLWEAVSGGVVIDSGSVNDIDFSSKDAHTIEVDPDGDFDFLYIALDPDDIDGNDKVRINRIATLEEQANDDIVLGFRLNSDDDDGDHSPADPGYEEFYVTVLGDNGGEIDPGIVIA